MSSNREGSITQQFYRNVNALAKANHYPISELEQTIGVCNGYFSRGRKKNSIPSIEIVYTVSRLFDLPMEELLSKDCEKRIRKPLIKAALTDVISIAGEDFSKEDVIQILREEM